MIAAMVPPFSSPRANTTRSATASGSAPSTLPSPAETPRCTSQVSATPTASENATSTRLTRVTIIQRSCAFRNASKEVSSLLRMAPSRMRWVMTRVASTPTCPAIIQDRAPICPPLHELTKSLVIRAEPYAPMA
jgi:hypothetical protein